ncbi:DUF6468 domain-containing protein [Roseicyclus sp.]|jgi:hypothetical protein
MLVYLSLAADLLMVAASLGAAVYCLVLSRRLSRLTSFDKGIGGAIAVMSQQVDEMRAALAEARTGTDGAGQHLQTLVSQAREISGELELMIAACHDFAEEAIAVQAPPRAGGVQAGVPDTAAAPAAPPPDAPPPPTAEVAVPVFGSRRAATVAAARA